MAIWTSGVNEIDSAGVALLHWLRGRQRPRTRAPRARGRGEGYRAHAARIGSMTWQDETP